MSEVPLYWVCPCMLLLDRMTHERNCEKRLDLRKSGFLSGATQI